jgi:hypothetical protein
MTRVVHVPYTVEQDEDGVWCAHAQLRPGVGANGDGPTREAAIADLREALTARMTEFGVPDELTYARGRLCRRCRPFEATNWSKLWRRSASWSFAFGEVTPPPFRQSRYDGPGPSGSRSSQGDPRNILADAGLTMEELKRLI